MAEMKNIPMEGISRLAVEKTRLVNLKTVMQITQSETEQKMTFDK